MLNDGKVAGDAIVLFGDSNSDDLPTRTPFQGTRAGGDTDGFVTRIAADPPVVRAFIVPKKVALRLPGKKGKGPGIKVAGTVDTGPDVVDLTLPGTLTVGTRVIQLPGMALDKRGRTFSVEGDGVSLRMRALGRDSSRGKLTLTIDGDLTGEADPNGAVPVVYSTSEFTAVAVGRLSGCSRTESDSQTERGCVGQDV